MENEVCLSLIAGSAAFLYLNSIRNVNAKRKKKIWIKYLLRRRASHGAFNAIFKELALEDRSGYKNFVRMTPTEFEVLLKKVAPLIVKKDTNFRAAISPAEQLAVTLRFLATGDSYASLEYLYRISKSKISLIVPAVCEAICKVLKEYIQTPTTTEEWEKVADEFNTTWNYPHCLGALDGRHVEIKQPKHSGSTFYNYKGTFSIVLLALVDARYQFRFVDIGMQGRISDGGVFFHTKLYEALRDKKLNIPKPTPLPGRQLPSPFVIVADDAFALSETLMKPYPGHFDNGSIQRAFNYRLSRARRISENAFGILTTVFRSLRKPLELTPENSLHVTYAAVHLHNYLRRYKRSRDVYSPPGSFDREDTERGVVIPGEWREHETLLRLQPKGGKATQTAKEIRDEFAEFFVSEVGRVPWQSNFA